MAGRATGLEETGDGGGDVLDDGGKDGRHGQVALSPGVLLAERPTRGRPPQQLSEQLACSTSTLDLIIAASRGQTGCPSCLLSAGRQRLGRANARRHRARKGGCARQLDDGRPASSCRDDGNRGATTICGGPRTDQRVRARRSAGASYVRPPGRPDGLVFVRPSSGRRRSACWAARSDGSPGRPTC